MALAPYLKTIYICTGAGAVSTGVWKWVVSWSQQETPLPQRSLAACSNLALFLAGRKIWSCLYQSGMWHTACCDILWTLWSWRLGGIRWGPPRGRFSLCRGVDICCCAVSPAESPNPSSLTIAVTEGWGPVRLWGMFLTKRAARLWTNFDFFHLVTMVRIPDGGAVL